jgi:hypothetical protein
LDRDDERMDDFDLHPDLSELEEDFRRYGVRDQRPWASPVVFDGQMAYTPRRPELLGDGVDAWWADLTSWVEWAVPTFRLARLIPPCWPQHPALVEELMALWLFWQAVWLPATDATAPIGFLRELEFAHARIERLYKPSCNPGEHTSPAPVVLRTTGTPDLHRWWSNPNYTEE